MATIARPPCDEAEILAGSCERPATTNGAWILAATPRLSPPRWNAPEKVAKSRSCAASSVFSRVCVEKEGLN